MKTLHLLLLLLLSCMPVSLRADDIISRLDQTVEHRQDYIDHKQRTIDHLKELLAHTSPQGREQLYEELYLHYKAFNTDSARHYNQLFLEAARHPVWGNQEAVQRAQLYEVQCLSVSGMYNQAWELITPLEGRLLPANRCLYYATKCELYVWESSFSSFAEAYDQHAAAIIACRDSIIAHTADPLDALHQRAIIARDTDLKASNALILPVIDTLSVSNPWMRHYAYLAGMNYEELGMRDSMMHYYALSATADLEQGILEHASLRTLTHHLYADGDITRAYNYMRICLSDAQACNARLRMVEIAREMPFILDAYHKRIDQQRDMLIAGMVALIVVIVIVILFALKVHRDRLRLKEANAKILEYHDRLRRSKERLEVALGDVMTLNGQLRESNTIKEAYIIQYMKQMSESVAVLEDYRSSLHKLAMRATIGKVLETVKSTAFIEEELAKFYQTFDDTFLALFPTFVADFNTLLRPEERFPEPLATGEGGKGCRLTTELRIFALIRLGITDSEEIAAFLRHSVKTIYNYRSRIRNRAIVSRANLEAELCKIATSPAPPSPPTPDC